MLKIFVMLTTKIKKLMAPSIRTKEVHLLLKSYGFKFDSSTSKNLKEALKSGSGYYWWLESVSVWSVG